LTFVVGSCPSNTALGIGAADDRSDPVLVERLKPLTTTLISHVEQWIKDLTAEGWA
jgi:hypothetical protein